MNEFINSLIISLFVSLILKALNSLWKYINSEIKNKPKHTAENVRKQFFIFLISSVICFFVYSSFNVPTIRILSMTFFLFSAMSLWGCFDELYSLYKHFCKCHPDNNSTKTP